jgi:hypothetical protein
MSVQQDKLDEMLTALCSGRLDEEQSDQLRQRLEEPEVTPAQDVKVHDFKGEVLVDEPSRRRPLAAAQHLRGNQGLRLESDGSVRRMFDGADEAFIRNIDDAERDRHVVVYWRFEDQPIGTLVPNTDHNSRADRATVDSSFNGNDRYYHTALSQPTLR